LDERSHFARLLRRGLSDCECGDTSAVLNPRRARAEAGKGTQFAQAVQELGCFFVMFRVIGDQGSPAAM
jgi:hypothetical protein